MPGLGSVPIPLPCFQTKHWPNQGPGTAMEAFSSSWTSEVEWGSACLPTGAAWRSFSASDLHLDIICVLAPAVGRLGGGCSVSSHLHNTCEEVSTTSTIPISLISPCLSSSLCSSHTNLLTIPLTFWNSFLPETAQLPPSHNVSMPPSQ